MKATLRSPITIPAGTVLEGDDEKGPFTGSVPGLADGLAVTVSAGAEHVDLEKAEEAAAENAEGAGGGENKAE